MSKSKVGIIGGAGYTGGELLRILLFHPNVEIAYIHSNSNAGNPVWKVHEDLAGYTDLTFASEFHYDLDAVFLCVGHGSAKTFLEENPVPDNVVVIDLSTDFRHKRAGNDFVYGLPELNKEKIKGANRIANPGCFATCIQMGLLPLAAAGKLPEVHVTGITGSTGAGQSPGATTHFSYRLSNLSVYKAFSHQHLQEIGESVAQLQPSFDGPINFVPVRGDFARGIMASAHFDSDLSEAEAVALYKNFYKDSPFTTVVDFNPSLKNVVNTNKAVVYVKKYGEKLHIISMIDNLLKGASGQAVENFNLRFGLDPMAGLQLKPSAF